MDKPDYIKEISPDSERRFIAHPVTARSSEDNGLHVIEGIAAKVNSRTNLGWFDEMIMPGAFDAVLNDDVRCLFNHDPNLILARSNTNTKTLSLAVNAEGHLEYSYRTPDRSYARDLQDAIMAGDVSQCSFAFMVEEEAWEYSQTRGENDLRKIVKMRALLDVAPVTYPAYADTSVAKRGYINPTELKSIAPALSLAKLKLTLIKKR